MAPVRGVTLGNPQPCRWCGAESTLGPCPWSVECPICLAPAGIPCKRVDGHQSFTHLERGIAAAHGEAVTQMPDQPPLFNADNPEQEALNL